MKSKLTAGLYARLSRDDNNGDKPSMSIENQITMLKSYVEEKGWEIFEIYSDDGYSGTNFERPAFKRMIRDAERKLIDVIITKDLSRLGRNYVQTGYYTDEYFNELGVRFIAINDNIDTKQDDNDIAAFHHVLNELYPKQVSKKVRQVKATAAKEGKFMGSQAPYGYQKSPDNKHLLIADPEAAEIVKRIYYEFLAGNSGRLIATRLNQEGIDCPRFYHYRKAGKLCPLGPEKNFWGSAAVLQLMRNEAYAGDMVQGKRQVVSFKTKRKRCVPEEDWIVVRNTHEPLVDRTAWNAAQERMSKRGSNKVRQTKDGTVGIFSGKVFCADCGAPLAFMTKKCKSHTRGIYRCSRYNNYGKEACSSHYIDESYLAAFVLNDIRLHGKLTKTEREHLALQLFHAIRDHRATEGSSSRKALQEVENRLITVTSSIKNAYIDKASRAMPEDIAIAVLESLFEEKRSLDAQKESLERKLTRNDDVQLEVDKWLDLIKSCIDTTVLDRDMVLALIDAIKVSEVAETRSTKHQEITIKYNFIGTLLEHTKKDIA